MISLFPWFFAAIAFKKRSFLKYFDTEANYMWFHKTIARIFPAPTLEIASLLQSNLCLSYCIGRNQSEDTQGDCKDRGEVGGR